jgi:hypothetical protein
MKNRLLSFLGIAVLLVATGVAAQTTDPAMTAQTVSGKVISSTSSSLVIETDTGTRQTFVVDAQSTLPAGLTPGTRISVDYHTLAGGTFHAARATSLGAAPAQPTTEARPVEPAPLDTTTPAAPPDTTPAPVTPPDTTPAPAAPMSTTTDTPESTPRSMPATASPLPLVGLVGLASLAAGAALRRFGRR